MNNNWQHCLTQSGAHFSPENGELLHFGDAAGELQAAAGGTVVAPLVHLGLIAAGGEDARSFLHGQFTADMNHLKAGQASHAAWCSAKGRMMASFLAWTNDDGFRLLLAADLQEAIQKRLQMFVLRAKVKLAALNDDFVSLGLAGPQAAELLAAAGLPVPGAVLATAGADDVTVIQPDAGRFIAVVPAARAESVWAALAAQARPVGAAAWRWLDIRAAYPLITAATREEFVPQMADFEKIGGVSFQKGCYPGQEIVARTQYLGKVKRHLFRLTSEVALASGDELHSPDNPDQSVGKVMTAAPAPSGSHAALAVVQSNFAGNLRLGSLNGPAVSASAVNPE